jgi:DNA-binding NtrC family response regulator
MMLPEDAQAAARDTVLFVDDEANILAALRRTLRREGYAILTAASASEAFALLAKHSVQVIVSDQRMPEMNGTEFLARVKSLYPATVRMVLSGYSEISVVADSINKGAVYRFMLKPWDDDDLKAEIVGALRHWRELYDAARNTD